MATTNELKFAVREVLVELLSEDNEIRGLVAEVFEDIAFGRAIEEARKSKTVPREKAMKILRGGKKKTS
jgi:hypothetical protein